MISSIVSVVELVPPNLSAAPEFEFRYVVPVIPKKYSVYVIEDVDAGSPWYEMLVPQMTFANVPVGINVNDVESVLVPL